MNEPEQQQRRCIRLAGFDYTAAGAYFVTIVTEGRECRLGEVVEDTVRLSPVKRSAATLSKTARASASKIMIGWLSRSSRSQKCGAAHSARSSPAPRALAPFKSRNGGIDLALMRRHPRYAHPAAV